MDSQKTLEDLEPRKANAITALIDYSSVQKAAEATGVARSTLYSWLADPEFAAVYRAARREALSAATGRLQSTADRHVETLLAVSTNPEAPSSSRVAAAKAALEMAYKANDIQELEDKVSEIERIVTDEA